MKSHILQQLLRDQDSKTAVALATNVENGTQTLVYQDSATGPDSDSDDILSAARQSMRDDRSRMVEIGDTRIFMEVFNPPKRLLIVGAVHIAQPLSRMASIAGYDVTIVDPRGSFATSERFPGISLCDDWPDDALRKLDPDRRTAIVTLTHDPKLDDPGLEVALGSDAFYIGALGSRRTHAARLERLTSSGLSGLERIHAPVGLNIGAVSPAEIAVAVLAQITEVLHQPPVANT